MTHTRHPQYGPVLSLDPDGLDCYSDHAHDICETGACMLCGSVEVLVIGHVMSGTQRLYGLDPVAASALVMERQSAVLVDGVLLDAYSASAVQAVYAALSTEAAREKLRGMSLVRAVDVCFRVAGRCLA